MRPVFRQSPLAGRRPAAALAAAAAAAAVGLAACGGPGTNGLEKATAAEVGNRAADAFRDASSVRVVGDTDSGGRSEDTRYNLVLTGTSAKGTIDRNGIDHEIIKVGADTYVRAGREYYEALGEADAAGLLAGRWVRLSSEAAEQYKFFTRDGLALSVTQYTKSLAGPVTTTKVGDAAAVSAASPNGSTLWAANTGNPYPLRLKMSGADTGTLEFSDYDHETKIAPPADALDFSLIE
jgi:hypothetical protein